MGKEQEGEVQDDPQGLGSQTEGTTERRVDVTVLKKNNIMRFPSPDLQTGAPAASENLPFGLHCGPRKITFKQYGFRSWWPMQRAQVLEINQSSSPVPLSHINHSIMMGIKAICKETILSTSESLQRAINNLNVGSRKKAETVRCTTVKEKSI